MAIDYLNKNGLSYFWSKLKAYFAPKVHTHTAFETKHSYTTATNAAKNWYRIANANTSQIDTTKPIHAQFILTAYNASYDSGYYERWFVNAEVFGRAAHIVILGNASTPFSQARILYENTAADVDANDRPAIDIYLNYVLPNGTTKIEIEEVYNSGWTFVNNGQISASTVPTGFENLACSPRSNGVTYATNADSATLASLQRSNFTANFTLDDNNTYRGRVLNCTGTITVTVPSINSAWSWFIIKNFNTTSGVITIHPSTTSVLIDGSNANITLQPGEYIMIHSKAANAYTIVFDGRWKSQKADKGTTLSDYGITDAKIANGTITLGSNSITPLTSHQTLPTLSRTISGSGNAITDITVSNHAITATKGATFLTSHQTLPTLSKTDSGSGNAVTDISVSNHAITVTKGSTFLTSHQSLSNYVTLDSAQTITGTKTVTTDFIMYDDDPSITFKYKTPARGTAPSTGYYTTVADIKDKNGYRFAGLYHEYLTNRGNTLSLIVYNGLSTSSAEWSSLQIGYDNSGTPFTTAINPPAAATDNRIATCKWVTDKGYLTSHQSLASCVKTSGDQDISGYKVFTTSLTVKRVNPYLYFIETDATKGGATSTDFQGIYFCDKNFDSTAANDNYTLAQIARVGATANENMVIITAKTNTANTNTGYTLSFGHTGGKTNSDWYFLPSGNGVVKLGSNAHRWGQIYSSVSTISTSDARVKNSVADVSGDVLDAWDRVGWKQFKFNSSVEEKGFDAARLHTGVVAQDIESVFAASGLDARRYGLFCYDEWEEEADLVNSQGSLLREGGPAGSLYSVRYEEALCIEAAYMRRENARLKKRVADLEDRLAALELKVS